MAEDAKQIDVDAYYKEANPKKRGKILEALMQEDPSEENQIRKELYDLRYASKSQRKDGDLADGYMGLWMTMKLTVDNAIGFFGNRSAKKEMHKWMDKLQIPKFMNGGELSRKLLYNEFYHMAALYMDASTTDRNYTSAFMGLMPLGDEQVQEKLTKDIYKVAFLMPARVDMQEEFRLFTQATEDAFRNIMPDSREYLEELLKEEQ